MSKKFKNIENDEAFKNFKLEDYMPSMPKHEQEESSSVAEQEPVVEAGNLFPILDEPDTSAEQVTEPETSAGSDNEARETEADNVSVELTIARRISSKQRRLSLDEYRATYLRVPKIADRKPVFVSGEVRDRLDEIVRRLGGRGMSVSGLIENLARQHMEAYGEDIEQWRKL